MMTVLKSFRSRKFLAALSALAAVAATLFGANVASGDEVWHQSYQRDSASEACVGQAGETPWQDSWGTNPGWSPSWEQWANNGQGGWVCSRSITWARDSAAQGYNIGDIGPGGGLVFYIDSTSGLRYEMAPKNWNDPTNPTGVDPTKAWITNAKTCYATNSSVADQNCQSNNLYPGTTDAQTASTNAATAIGMGSVNTADIKARMVAGGELSSAYAAGLASAYAGGGYSDWFLPSKGELNEMCKYSRNPASPPVTCTGSQNVAFAADTYGFNNVSTEHYWSSSQLDRVFAWVQRFFNGNQFTDYKNLARPVRPVRAF